MITNHPETELLLEYSSGSLPLAPCIAVTTHLQFCSSCNATAEALKDIGGDLLESHDSVDVSASLLDRVLDRVGEPESRLTIEKWFVRIRFRGSCRNTYAACFRTPCVGVTFHLR